MQTKIQSVSSLDSPSNVQCFRLKPYWEKSSQKIKRQRVSICQIYSKFSVFFCQINLIMSAYTTLSSKNNILYAFYSKFNIIRDLKKFNNFSFIFLKKLQILNILRNLIISLAFCNFVPLALLKKLKTFFEKPICFFFKNPTFESFE